MNEDLFSEMETAWTGFNGQEPNPLIYAYLGDAVYELLVRSYLIREKPRKINQLHQKAIRLVCAKQQKNFLEKLLPVLTEEEKEIVRRARNSKPKHVPQNISTEEYMTSTSFEAMMGYLYLQGKGQRLHEIIKFIFRKYQQETEG